MARLTKSQKVELLEHLPLFETCTKQELGGVASITTDGTRQAGTLLTRQGRDGGVMFVIVEGEAEVVAVDPVKPDRVLRKLGPGDVVGELSLIDGKVRSASVRAVTDVRVLEIVADDFDRLIYKSPKFVRNLLRALSVKVRETESLTS